jgi:hypothetical protein
MYNERFLDPFKAQPDKFSFPLQTGIWDGTKGRLVARPDFRNVPVMSDLIKPSLKGVPLEAFEVWEKQVQVGKWYGLPPHVSDEIIAVYRTAFNKAIKEPEFDKTVRQTYDKLYVVQTPEELRAVAVTLHNVSDAAQEYQAQLLRKVGVNVEMAR